MPKEKKEQPKLTGLDKVIQTANQQCGPGTCVTGREVKRDPPRLPFGIFAVDLVTGGGSPIWGTTCLWGPNAAGKTSLAINAMAMAGDMCWRCYRPHTLCTCSQKPKRMRTFWADVEGALDRDWVEAIGASPDSYVQALADYGEQYVNLCVAALQADDCGLVVGDALAALTPAAEMEAAAEDDFMALQPRMIGRAVRVMKQHLIRERKKEHPCTIIFVNQMRYKIGQIFGDKEAMTGGEAMKHEFSLLLRCGKRTFSKADKEKYVTDSSKHELASRHSFSIRKAKVLTLAGVGEYVRIKENIPELGLAKGAVDDLGVLMTYARDAGIVVQGKSKKWLYFDHTAKRLDDIKRLWQAKPDERFRTSDEIIRRVKAQLASPKKG